MTSQRARRALAGARAERKHRAIVEAARELFLSEGFAATTEAIAAAAGVSVVTLYNHFGSKEELFTTVLISAVEGSHTAMVDAAEERLAAGDHGWETLVRTVRQWVHQSIDPSALALRYLVGHEGRRFPELARAWDERGPGRFRAVLAATLQRLTASGELRIDDMDLAISQLYALLLYPHFVADASGVRLDPVRTEQLIASGTDMFHTYYAATTTRPRTRDSGSGRFG